MNKFYALINKDDPDQSLSDSETNQVLIFCAETPEEAGIYGKDYDGWDTVVEVDLTKVEE